MSKAPEASVMAFSNGTVKCYYDISFNEISAEIKADRIITITDENLYKAYPEYFPAGSCIILPAGEDHKNIETICKAIDELLLMEADRDVFLLGVGGGIVTDVTGFLASVYLRGVRFGFAPTSILAMVDAAVGGKNGVNSGMYKNQIGTVYQPQYLFFNYDFLRTLPEVEWVSGFAEIIKHACIRDEEMFQFLANNQLDDFRKDLKMTGELVRRNAELKFSVASGDEKESGQRRLLNFGHTIGHAIEKITSLPHGFAISVGMRYACIISEKLAGFPAAETQRVVQLLEQYHLPVEADFNKDAAWEILLHDKKKSGTSLYFVLLENIGKGTVTKLALDELKQLFYDL